MRIKKKIIFLTGGTGFLGSYLLAELLKSDNFVYLLVRSKGFDNKEAKVKGVLQNFFDETEIKRLLSNNISIIGGDIQEESFAASSHDIKKILGQKIDIFVHSAAIADLAGDWKTLSLSNVTGTKVCMDIALKMFKNNKGMKFVHISTIFVKGNFKGVFSEDDLSVGQEFYNAYEKSKYEAEVYIRLFLKQGMDIIIFRPSMIAGESMTGKTTNFNLFYQPLHFFSKGLFLEFPANLRSELNIVNIDIVARHIVELIMVKKNQTYHLVNSQNITVGSLLKLSSEFFEFELPVIKKINDFNEDRFTLVQKKLAGPFIPYLNYSSPFVGEYTFKILQENNFKIPIFSKNNLMVLFKYCKKVSYIS